MKTFKRQKRSPKSWAIDKIEIGSEKNVAVIVAVDSVTGKVLANLIAFLANGEVFLVNSAKKSLKIAGYNPYEHGNTWTSHGALRIQTGI